MPQRPDPDSIQREIEQTRAELAAAIDAIADRVSPRRAAQRGVSRVKEAVGSARTSTNGQHPALLPGESERRLRYDRIAIVATLAAAVTVAIVLLRRGRDRN